MFVKDMQIKIFIDGEEIRCGNEKDPRKDLLKTLLIQSIKITCFLFTKKLINIRMAITVALANAIKIQMACSVLKAPNQAYQNINLMV